MKINKKTLIIIGILLVIGLVTCYLDSTRVKASIEPKYTIKYLSKDGDKVTYWGLGYKVIKYVNLSVEEPLSESKAVKFGTWFMGY